MVNPPDDDRMYCPVWAAARYVGRSEATIREWARHSKVRSLHTDALRVHLPDVVHLDNTAPRRNGGRNQRAAEACGEWIVDKIRTLNAH
ncbi:hypothetical protein [Streptosporangium saharense]|uniref:hypothetical protein n=1 Tax=Streptosporangium saharense TaxID=1706840 RepID=UPI00331E15C2